MMVIKIIIGLVLVTGLVSHGATETSTLLTTNLTFMGFNIWHNGTKVKDGIAKVREVIATVRPDVVAFSEINSEATALAIAELESPELKYHVGYLPSNDVAILSRYPISKAGPLVGARISMFELSVHGTPVLVGAAHLDYTHYACYLPRGYACAGSPPYTNWNQIGSSSPQPMTNLAVIAAQNLASQRDEQINAFLGYVKEVNQPVVLIGDFNEPSHLDWTTNQANLFDHHGVVFQWPTTLELQKSGFVDAFRKIYPDEVRHPGITWPSFATGVTSTSWAAKSDDRDRIDFIFYKGTGVEATTAALVGPKGSYVKNELSTANTDHDHFIADQLPWPSDHKAIFANLKIPLSLSPTNDLMKKAMTEVSKEANSTTLQIPFLLETNESNAALLGRQCAVIWFASESKVYTEAAISKDIIAAPIMAKALGVSYTEEQFRNAFRNTEPKVAGDFDTLIPEMIKKEKGERVRDIYLYSYWCTAARMWVSLVPLWKEVEKQEAARRWVAIPLAKAQKMASAYDQGAAAACQNLGERSLSDPLGSFDLADKFAGEVLKVQRSFLSKYLTADQVDMVTQSFLKRTP